MSGDLTNSDFELTALIVNTIALMSQHISTPHAAIWCGSNNTSAASWCKKGSTSSIGSTAHLLQWLAQLTWDYHVLLTPFHISSSTNAMANFCSRSFLLIRNSFRNLTKNSLYTLLGHLPHLHQMWPWKWSKPYHQRYFPGDSQQQASANDATWNRWQDFCSNLDIDQTLQDIPDFILSLQVFPHQYHGGDISPSKTPAHRKMVGDAIQAIGQMLANMGYSDPHLLPSGKLNFHLSGQLSYYSIIDPPHPK